MQHQLRSKSAFTAKELIFVIAALVILACLWIPARVRERQKSERITCVSNLKCIGVATRVWSPDSSDALPAQRSKVAGGWRDYLERTNGAQYYLTNFVLMENELGHDTKLLVCPSDNRTPASSFKSLRNTNISYFLGQDANENYPLSILNGDRNLAPGLTPEDDYGFSSTNGQGNDVWLKTNEPVCWSLKMHSAGNTNGAGNILMGDGSAQQMSSLRFRVDYQSQAALTNWQNSTEHGLTSFRLIFP
jgi:hypothetical protein